MYILYLRTFILMLYAAQMDGCACRLGIRVVLVLKENNAGFIHVYVNLFSAWESAIEINHQYHRGRRRSRHHRHCHHHYHRHHHHQQQQHHSYY